MISFNTNNIIVGYIKQLLTSFNLPHIHVYKQNETFLYDNALYIKDGFIQKYVNGKFFQVEPFTYGRRIPNYTSNLSVNSLIYDSHTHEYLGNYLRFLRDYKDLNLMSMYNCFSNRLISNLNIQWTYEEEGSIKTQTFSSKDNNYKIYCFPVKFNKKYTIALSCKTAVEITCGLYSKSLTESTISQLTYKKIGNVCFTRPFIYEELTKDELKDKFFYEHEDDLKMFIKLPIYENTSIVVLEGEYLNTNTKIENPQTKEWEHTSTVINYKTDELVKDSIENYPKTEYAWNAEKNEYIPFLQYFTKTIDNKHIKDIKLVSSLQLLQLNSGTSYPFADRLVEYLTDNTITHIDTISDNIIRLQKTLVARHDTSTLQNPKTGIDSYKNEGIWEDKYRDVIYDVAKQTGVLNNKFDILGYVDKDIEAKMSLDIDIYKEE